MSTASVSRRVHVEHVMGTVVSLDVRAGGDDAAVHDAMAWLHEVDRRFSTYREDREIRRLERGELALSHASADLKRSSRAARRSGARPAASSTSARPVGSTRRRW